MKRPAHVVEVFLNPGEYHFGDRNTCIRTLLGSCVAITLWHPALRVGGMCHYLLPKRKRGSTDSYDAKYADEALYLLFREVARTGASVKDYEVKMFGGGNMFPHITSGRADHVGSQNAEAGRQLARQHGMRHMGEDLEGTGHRNVIFDLWSGHVWVRRNDVARVAVPAPASPPHRLQTC